MLWYVPAFGEEPYVEGVVRDTLGNGVSYATVGLLPESAETGTAEDGAVVIGSITDEAGRYRIDGVAAGHYRLVCAHLSFVSQQRAVVVRSGRNVYDFRLVPAAEAIEGVEVVGTTMRSEAGKYSRAFTEDTLFAWCSLTVLAGFLFLPAGNAAGDLSFCLLTVGSQSFYAFMLSVLACMGARNPSGAIIFAATGSALSSCGSAIGASVHGFVTPLERIAPGEAMELVTATIALVIIVYVFVALRNFSFTRFFQEIAPARRPRVAEHPVHAAGSDDDGAGAGTSAGTSDEGDVSDEAEASDEVSLTTMLARDYDLTAREQEIATMLARGRNGTYIQERLVISRNTVKTHTRHIYAKLGIHSQQELIDLFEGR